MKYILDNLFLSDSWFLHGRKAYFSTVFADCILEADFDHNIVNMKGSYYNAGTYRMHPVCFVNCEKIYLLPDKSNDIIVFDMEGNVRKRIPIHNPTNARIGARSYYISDSTAWIICDGLSKLIEFDLCGDTILDAYDLKRDEDDIILGSAWGVDNIFVLTSGNKVYTFDILNRVVSSFRRVDTEDKLNTIGFDGQRLWFTGKKKKVYSQDWNGGMLHELNILPNDFDVYDPGDDGVEHYIFCRVFVMNNRIWMMQYYGNMDLCIEIKDWRSRAFTVNMIKFPEPKCIRDYPLNVFLYIRDNRYIGKIVDPTCEVFEVDSMDLSSRLVPLAADQSLNRKIMLRVALREKEGYGVAEYLKDYLH